MESNVIVVYSLKRFFFRTVGRIRGRVYTIRQHSGKKALTVVGGALSFCASYRVNSYKSAAPKLFLIERVGGVGFFVVVMHDKTLVQLRGRIADQDTQRFLALPM
jgi:hypothetical protein